jgi:hypothetical protein
VHPPRPARVRPRVLPALVPPAVQRVEHGHVCGQGLLSDHVAHQHHQELVWNGGSSGAQLQHLSLMFDGCGRVGEWVGEGEGVRGEGHACMCTWQPCGAAKRPCGVARKPKSEQSALSPPQPHLTPPRPPIPHPPTTPHSTTATRSTSTHVNTYLVPKVCC